MSNGTIMDRGGPVKGWEFERTSFRIWLWRRNHPILKYFLTVRQVQRRLNAERTPFEGSKGASC